MNTPIGWPLRRENWSIKQGDSGTKRITMVVKNADNTPLDSYDGWTAELTLMRRPSNVAEITLESAVIGDAGTMSLSVDLAFIPATTQDLYPGTLFGDLRLEHPTFGRHRPVNVTLEIQRSYGAAA